MDDLIAAIGMYWANKITDTELRAVILDKRPDDVADFIIAMQGRGCFGRGIIHP